MPAVAGRKGVRRPQGAVRGEEKATVPSLSPHGAPRTTHALDRFYLCARIQMQDGRPRRVCTMVMTGRQLAEADTRLRRVSRGESGWFCLKELSETHADHVSVGAEVPS